MKNWTKWMLFMHQRRMNIHIHWTFSRGNLHILLKCEKSLKSKHHPLLSPLLQACALFHTIPQTSHRQNVSSNSKIEWNLQNKNIWEIKKYKMIKIFFLLDGIYICAWVCVQVQVYHVCMYMCMLLLHLHIIYVCVYRLEIHECAWKRNKTWPIQVYHVCMYMCMLLFHLHIIYVCVCIHWKDMRVWERNKSWPIQVLCEHS